MGSNPTPCEMCGGWLDGDEPECICPECDVCGEYGHPECYEKHGLRVSLEQEAQLKGQKGIRALGEEIQRAVKAAALPVDPTPGEVLEHCRAIGRCMFVISRACAAGIKPTYAVVALVAAALCVKDVIDKWEPPTNQ